MTELVRDEGVAVVTVAHVVERSGVSRRTFYELFNDREDCLLAAFEQAVRCAAAVVIPAYQGEGVGVKGTSVGVWVERMRVGLAALLEFFDKEPAMGGLCVVDALAADRCVVERRTRVVDVLIEVVHQGGAPPRGGATRRVQSGDRSAAAPGGAGAKMSVAAMNGAGGSRQAPGPPRIVAEGAVGAVLAVVHARMRERDPKPLVGLLNQLMGMIVLPYLGPEAAAKELERPAPRPPRRPASTTADPLRDLGMRLTYRTVRVLLAIAELGGQGSSPSSRQVADASGVADQGQMSKLLWRLESLGLIDNAVRHHGRGEPNAWSLTPKGQEVERAIRAQTSRSAP